METQYRLEGSRLVNLMPFVCMPERISVVRLKTALRFRPPGVALAQAGTFIHNGDEIWSYPYKPNSNDIVAGLLYTSTKEGDKGTFLDLKFVDGKLVSWAEAEHTMPPKERSGFGAGINAPAITGVGGPSNPTSHY